MPPKKGGKKNKNDDWDDDAAEKRIAALTVSEPADDWEEEVPKPKPKAKGNNKNKMAAFAMLMEETPQQEEKDEPEKAPSEDEDVKEVVVEETKKKKDKKKGKKEKKGKAAEEEEDIDAILASFESKDKAEAPKEVKADAVAPSEVKEPTPEAEAPEAADEEKKKKKKKKKDKKKAEGDDEAEEAGEEEKKEEEEGEEGSEAEGGEEEKDKKKKKKKKDKKKGEKEEKPKKKRQIDLIKEMLKQQQELREKEEQRIKEEEERLEQLEKEREERERLAKEQKEREKEEKRLLIEKQKAAGTYLTAAQKKQQREALEKLKARGINIPVPVERAPEDEQNKGKTFVHLDAKALRKLEEKKRRKAEAKGLTTAQATPKEATPEEEQPKPVVEAVSTSVEEPPAAAQEEDDDLDDWELAADEPTESKAKVDAPVAKAAVSVEKAPQAKQPVLADTKAVSQEEESEEESDDSDSSEEESEEESSSDEETGTNRRETKEQIIEKVKLRIKKRQEEAEKKRTTDNLRSPVICVLGHVDTGKTKMLDTIRRTNVQQGEAGGITQQIGATEVPGDAIKERCRQVRDFKADDMKIPGFLIIDTPGHESFSNLRTRGQSLCDFAILVVDVMHGLEQQTIESLKMLIKGKTPFVVALNKVDRLYEYESNPRKDIYEHLKTQSTRVKQEFEERFNSIFAQFAEQGVNIALSNKNKNTDEYVSVVPTSAYLGDGIGNLMSYIVNQTQTVHAQKLAFSEELDATVMEVKAIPGLGTTIDVILVNGTMRVGDVIVLTGTDGAIVTQIRELLMPKPLKELRVKNEYLHYKEVSGARGVKLLAKNLEKTLAGLPVHITDKVDEIDYLKLEAEAQLANALHDIKKKPEGVYVQASTLGSLEALLEFLKSQKIPYSNVNIGPVHKKDVQKAAAMKEHKIEYACILAFDVKVERDAQVFADHEGVKIFQADIIYHLQDSFLKYREELREKARKEHEHLAIFPCRLRVMPNHVFNARNPIVCGVVVEAGQVKRGTPICVPSKENVFLGTIASIERNNEEVASAKQGDEVCIKIENTTGEAPRLYGRHFTHEDALVSRVSRESIDVCKTYFRDDLSRNDWQLIVQLKKLLDIM